MQQSRAPSGHSATALASTGESEFLNSLCHRVLTHGERLLQNSHAWLPGTEHMARSTSPITLLCGPPGFETQLPP